VTIAACYVTPEGVVLGADSTASAMLPGGFHYFNYNQKVFALGEPDTATLGVVTWGLGGLGSQSHRTVFAVLADELATKPAKSVIEVTNKLADQAWTFYLPLLARCHALNAKTAFDPKVVPANPGARTQAEEEAHYQRTGLYRATDLNRVLGDPRKQVSGETSDFLALACRAVHE
jgi:hypothetical protein